MFHLCKGLNQNKNKITTIAENGEIEENLATFSPPCSRLNPGFWPGFIEPGESRNSRDFVVFYFDGHILV